MVEIGTAEFVIDVSVLPESEFKEYSSLLFDRWEQKVNSDLPLPDFGIRLEVEEGSIRGRGLIVASAIALYAGISSFGSFVGGVREIANVARVTGSYLSDSAMAPFRDQGPRMRRQRGAGRVGQLERLFAKVQRGALEPEEAARIADAMFSGDDELPPELRTALRQAFAAMPRYPHQLPLDLDESLLVPVTGDSERRERRPPRPKPMVPPPERVRVEVWRETKRGPKLVNVTTL